MKVKVNRQCMLEPGMQALNIMLAVLNRVSDKMTQSYLSYYNRMHNLKQ